MVTPRFLALLICAVPLASKSATTVDVVEFYNAAQDHYFISSLQADIDALDSRTFPGWSRTGLTFKAYPQATPGASPVCRFYIPPAYGDSHFFSASPAECAQTAAKFPYLVLETASAMYMDLPNTVSGACPAGDVPVYRVWDMRADSNHRYTTSATIRAQMVARGWVAEGYGPGQVIMCAPPPAPSPTLVLSLGGATVYDVTNNVSWLANANLPATQHFGLPLCDGVADTKSCVNASGTMSYQAATAWVAAMNASGYLGRADWQLPVTPVPDASCGFIGPHGEPFGFGCMKSALGSLYHVGLGVAAPHTAVAMPHSAVGPFKNLVPYLYWSPSDDLQSGSGHYTFSFASGFQGSNTAPNFLYALPMLRGRIAGTPPAAGTALQVNPGGRTIYDPIADVTWLADANVAASNTFGIAPCTAPDNPKPCVDPSGAMSWDSATQFVADMNAAAYLGQTTWQLPPIDAGCGGGYGCSETGNPMGVLFYRQLGFAAGMSVAKAPDVAAGPFANLQPYLYWSCLGAAVQGPCGAAPPVPGFEFSFSFGNGFQGTDILQNDLYVTAYFVDQ